MQIGFFEGVRTCYTFRYQHVFVVKQSRKTRLLALRRFLHIWRHVLSAVAEDAAGTPDLDVSSWLAAWLPLVRDHTTTDARYLGFHGMYLLYYLIIPLLP